MPTHPLPTVPGMTGLRDTGLWSSPRRPRGAGRPRRHRRLCWETYASARGAARWCVCALFCCRVFKSIASDGVAVGRRSLAVPSRLLSTAAARLRRVWRGRVDFVTARRGRRPGAQLGQCLDRRRSIALGAEPRTGLETTLPSVVGSATRRYLRAGRLVRLSRPTVTPRSAVIGPHRRRRSRPRS